MKGVETELVKNLYCENLQRYVRRKSRIVQIGEVPLGGHYPIRVQSMTTTDTLDTEKTVAQSIRMIEAGCEYVRITAPSLKEAENLRNIKAQLRARGYNTPLVADIHFTPNAAELAARIVEKVRINPGNYADKKKFEVRDYSDSQYEAELERIRKRFTPLVNICKEHGTAMRIGVNHGSLSDRIMNRYGDTPEGMVESALEFLHICEDLDYRSLVLSMKSSNPLVMIQAYRMLVARMNELGMDYPLHLGVTEAGEDEEGRVKSALGIGTLLEDGLGDTIRVSLTEDPEFEIPVARALVDRYTERENHPAIRSVLTAASEELPYDPYHHKRREAICVGNLGGTNVPRVIADLSGLSGLNELSLKALDYHYDAITDKWNQGEQGADFIYLGSTPAPFMLPNGAKGLYDFNTWRQLSDRKNNHPVLTFAEYGAQWAGEEPHFIRAAAEEITEGFLLKLKADKTAVLILRTENPHALAAMRQVFMDMLVLEVKAPVIIERSYAGMDEERMILFGSTDIGGLLAEGFGDGVWLKYGLPHPPAPSPLGEGESPPLLKERGPGGEVWMSPSLAKLVNRTVFNILQAARTRISKTEYISCPSCGRTLFDLQETTAMIRAETDHLKGVKIAIMGCIVNGPGEMADADYGYVGTGVDRITLYRGKEVVKRNIESRHALGELINLIREDGLWIEKQELVS